MSAGSNQIGPLSANETAFIVTRAVRGAGVPYGLGEDVASGVVWLARQGVPAAAQTLLQALENFAATTSSCDICFNVAGDCTALATNDGIRASALFAGSAAADWLRSNADGQLLDISRVDQPLLVTGIAAAILQRAGRLLQPQDGGCLRNDPAAQAPESAMDQAIMVDGTAWQGVRDFFQRALVPATAESRTHGAGAGLIDRD